MESFKKHGSVFLVAVAGAFLNRSFDLTVAGWLIESPFSNQTGFAQALIITNVAARVRFISGPYHDKTQSKALYREKG
jgi:hypothetical protein